MSNKKNKFDGLLGEPLPAAFGEDPSMSGLNQLLLIHFHQKTIDAKLLLLLAHYDLLAISNAEQKWKALAQALAMQFVPGFQIGKQRGRKTAWSTVVSSFLLYEINKIAGEEGGDIKSIAAKLTTFPHWESFMKRAWDRKGGGDSAEAMRKQYYKICDNKDVLEYVSKWEELDREQGPQYVTEMLSLYWSELGFD